eukprot:scaffold60692_cov63-Phaeocystis_antarctica.AAC.1
MVCTLPWYVSPRKADSDRPPAWMISASTMAYTSSAWWYTLLWYRCGSGSRAAKQAWQHVRQHAEPPLSWLHTSSMPPIVLSQWQAGWPLRAELAGPGWRLRAEVASPLGSSESIRYSHRARELADALSGALQPPRSKLRSSFNFNNFTTSRAINHHAAQGQGQEEGAHAEDAQGGGAGERGRDVADGQDRLQQEGAGACLCCAALCRGWPGGVATLATRTAGAHYVAHAHRCSPGVACRAILVDLPWSWVNLTLTLLSAPPNPNPVKADGAPLCYRHEATTVLPNPNPVGADGAP